MKVNRREIFQTYVNQIISADDIGEIQDLFDYASGLIIKNQPLADSKETMASTRNASVYIQACYKQDNLTEHQREQLKMMYQESNPYYKELLDEYGIDPLISRTAEDYEIITSISKFENGNQTLTPIQERIFLNCYKQGLNYFNSVTRTKAWESDDMYREWSELYLIFVAIQRYITERMKNQFDVDTFNKFQCKNYFISNGVDYFDSFPIYYQRRLIKLLNDLQLNKGDDLIFGFIKDVLATNGLEFYKYELARVKDNEGNEDLKFYKVPYNELLNPALDEEYSFEEITKDDPYWRASKNEILNTSIFNTLHTKYISSEYKMSILENSQKLSYFFFMLNELELFNKYNKFDTKLAFFDNEISSNKISLYDSFLALFSLYYYYITNNSDGDAYKINGKTIYDYDFIEKEAKRKFTISFLGDTVGSFDELPESDKNVWNYLAYMMIRSNSKKHEDDEELSPLELVEIYDSPSVDLKDEEILNIYGYNDIYSGVNFSDEQIERLNELVEIYLNPNTSDSDKRLVLGVNEENTDSIFYIITHPNGDSTTDSSIIEEILDKINSITDSFKDSENGFENIISILGNDPEEMYSFFKSFAIYNFNYKSTSFDYLKKILDDNTLTEDNYGASNNTREEFIILANYIDTVMANKNPKIYSFFNAKNRRLIAKDVTMVASSARNNPDKYLEPFLNYVLYLLIDGYIDFEIMCVHPKTRQLLRIYLSQLIIEKKLYKITENVKGNFDYITYNVNYDIFGNVLLREYKVLEDFKNYVIEMNGYEYEPYNEFNKAYLKCADYNFEVNSLNNKAILKFLKIIDLDKSFMVRKEYYKYRNLVMFLDIFSALNKEIYLNWDYSTVFKNRVKEEDDFIDLQLSGALDIKNPSYINNEIFESSYRKNEENRLQLQKYINECNDKDLYKLMTKLWNDSFKSNFRYSLYAGSVGYLTIKEYLNSNSPDLLEYISNLNYNTDENNVRTQIEEKILHLCNSIENYIHSENQIVYNSSYNIIFSQIKNFAEILLKVFKAYTLDTLFSENIVDMDDKFGHNIKIFDELEIPSEINGEPNLKFTYYDYLDCSDSVFTTNSDNKQVFDSDSIMLIQNVVYDANGHLPKYYLDHPEEVPEGYDTPEAYVEFLNEIIENIDCKICVWEESSINNVDGFVLDSTYMNNQNSNWFSLMAIYDGINVQIDSSSQYYPNEYVNKLIMPDCTEIIPYELRENWKDKIDYANVTATIPGNKSVYINVTPGKFYSCFLWYLLDNYLKLFIEFDKPFRYITKETTGEDSNFKKQIYYDSVEEVQASLGMLERISLSEYASELDYENIDYLVFIKNSDDSTKLDVYLLNFTSTTQDDQTTYTASLGDLLATINSPYETMGDIYYEDIRNYRSYPEDNKSIRNFLVNHRTKYLPSSPDNTSEKKELIYPSLENLPNTVYHDLYNQEEFERFIITDDTEGMRETFKCNSTHARIFDDLTFGIYDHVFVTMRSTFSIDMLENRFRSWGNFFNNSALLTACLYSPINEEEEISE